MSRNKGNASAIGTATHTEFHYPESTSKSKRRSKTKCIYYDPAPKECSKEHIGCPGATKCKYYREIPPAPAPVLLPVIDIPDLTASAASLSAVKEGVVVRHKTFGRGTVTSIDIITNSIYVSFPVGEKRLAFPDSFTMGLLEIQQQVQPKKKRKKKAHPASVTNNTTDNDSSPNISSVDSSFSRVGELPTANASRRGLEESSQQVEIRKRRTVINWPIICGIGLSTLTLAFIVGLIGK